ncbi:MAG: ion transporter [Phycisphaerales bacterium]|nr:ion transporter [Phycisphaerales bacterium]
MNIESRDESFSPWRSKLHEIIFEANTPAGRIFDLALIIFIVLSVLCVMLDSVSEFRAAHSTILRVLEWFFTVVFTIEYGLRLLCVQRPWRYAISFYGLVDLLSILPAYLSLVIAGTHYLLVVRLLRILRIFRILKLVNYLGEARQLTRALMASRRKVGVFLFVVVTLVVILGSLMYVVEGEQNGFTSIPRSIYWAVVTLTTVGYGDIAPRTDLGQFLAAFIMILGYAIIAVPTGIVTVEMSNAFRQPVDNRACPVCAAEGHDHNALYCKFCGGQL